MTFSYGAAMTTSKITVSAIMETENEGVYQFITKSIETGER